MEQIAEIKEINNKTIRFSSAPWYSPGVEVFVGGAGGIGSWLCFFLARQEAKIYLYEYDSVDEVNLGGQMYNVGHVGVRKDIAIKDIITRGCGVINTELMGKYEQDSMTNKFVFSAFDNMKARKMMFSNWKEQYKDDKEALFVDGRMLAEEGQIYFVTNNRIEEYEKTLFDDNEVPLEDCSYKSTSHCGALISSMMVSGYNNHLTNIKFGEDMREVPFSIVYQLPLLNFTI